MSVLRAARFLLGLGMRVDRTRLIRACLLMLGGYIAAPLVSLALGRFADEALAGRTDRTYLLALLIAALLVAELMSEHFACLDYFELAEMQESGLRAELIDVVNGPPRIEHLDDPPFIDNVSLVRESLFATSRSLEAVLQLTGLLVQTAVTVAILATLNPWLVLMPLTALPPVLLANRAQGILERAREETAEQWRLNVHIVELATNAASVKELRIFAVADALLSRQADAWREITRRMWRAQAAGAALRAAGQVTFALGYGAAIFLFARQAWDGSATLGDLVVVITLAVQVSTQVTTMLQLLTLLHSAGRTVDRIDRLRATTSSQAGGTGSLPADGRLRSGLTLDRVSFTYPGSREPVLRDISLRLPAGHTVAVVGENGAGKSTFIKLLCGLYAPTGGRLLVDGADLADVDQAEWRTRIATLFQDFYRFQLTLGEGIGLGAVESIDDSEVLARAVEQAGAGRIVDLVPGGLSGYVGRAYEDGTELSGGQWQTVGLARCLMRQEPQLLVLDEPAAALDAAAEHALFERYASSASQAGLRRGGVTVLVSHRFSTVLMADTIAVLEKGRLVEHGSHAQLLARNGLYAELFKLQARAYQ